MWGVVEDGWRGASPGVQEKNEGEKKHTLPQDLQALMGLPPRMGLSWVSWENRLVGSLWQLLQAHLNKQVQLWKWVLVSPLSSGI